MIPIIGILSIIAIILILGVVFTFNWKHHDKLVVAAFVVVIATVVVATIATQISA